ncbi:hypothetical protein D3C74_442200 [compost metagenome]
MVASRTVGTTSSRPQISMVPSGTPSTPATASEPTPGTMKMMPHSSEMAMAVARRAVPMGPIFGAMRRASGAEITSSTSTKIDCSTVLMATAME